MDKLMEKLALAKAIMDKSDNIKRGEVRDLPMSESVASFDAPAAKYNIPKEFIADSQNNVSTKAVKQPTVDAIKNSKLPDEIKKLMIENPINIPQSPSVTLSEDLVERASKLMRKNDNTISETVKPKTENTTSSQIDYKLIKRMIEDSVNKSLKENGLLVESTERTSESFSFRVGKHIFEGKITKIKKIQE
jgi:hypothetical protein